MATSRSGTCPTPVKGQNLVCPFHRFAFTPRRHLRRHARRAAPARPPAAPHRQRAQRLPLRLVRTGWRSTHLGNPRHRPGRGRSDSRLEHGSTHLRPENIEKHPRLPTPSGPAPCGRAGTRPADGPRPTPAHASAPGPGPATRSLKQKIHADHTFLLAGLGHLRVELPLSALGLVSYLWAKHTPTGPRRTHMLRATPPPGRKRRGHRLVPPLGPPVLPGTLRKRDVLLIR